MEQVFASSGLFTRDLISQTVILNKPNRPYTELHRGNGFTQHLNKKNHPVSKVAYSIL